MANKVIFRFKSYVMGANRYTINKLICLIIFVLLGTIQNFAQDIFTLEEVIQLAKQQSPEAKQAETQKETSYWQYQNFKTNYSPQLRLSGNLPAYSKNFTPVRQPDGSIIYKAINQIIPSVNLGLQQPIWRTGGNISANTNFNYFNNIISNISQWNGTLVNVQLNQPIFAYNQLKWDRRTQPLIFEESKRAFVEQQELISNNAVTKFFDVLTAQINFEIAKFNIANSDTIYRIEQTRYNMGTASLDRLLQVELQLLRSRQDLGQASLDLETAGFELRSFIGLKDSDEFQLMLPENILQFELTLEDALFFARKNRAAYIAFERRRIEGEQSIAQSKGNRFQTSLVAAYGLNNSALTAKGLYVKPQEQQQVNLTFNIPVLDWGRNRSMMRTAIANKRLNDYVIAKDEVNFEQEIITKVRQFDILRLQIEITKKSDQVAHERYNVVQNRYFIGKNDITNLNIALTEKDNARRSYIQALEIFWTSYYDLRRLTLYNFVNKNSLYFSE